MFEFLSPRVLLSNIPAGPATNWRWPFVIVALPSLFVTGVMLAVVQEPPRGITEPALQVECVQKPLVTENHCQSKDWICPSNRIYCCFLSTQFAFMKLSEKDPRRLLLTASVDLAIRIALLCSCPDLTYNCTALCDKRAYIARVHLQLTS